MIQSARYRWVKGELAELQFRRTQSFWSVADNIIPKLKSNLPVSILMGWWTPRPLLYVLTQSIIFWLSSLLLSTVGPKVIFKFMNMSEQVMKEIGNIPVLHVSWQPSWWLPDDREYKHCVSPVPRCLVNITSSSCSSPERSIRFK